MITNPTRTSTSTMQRTCTCTMHITTHKSTISTIFVRASRAADKSCSLSNLRPNVAHKSGYEKWRNVLIACLVILVLPPIAFGQRDAKIPDPDPEVERKTFQV